MVSCTSKTKLFEIALLIAAIPTAAFGEAFSGEYKSIRSLGMGDATTPLANDDGSTWTNPAGIGRSRKARSRDGISLFKVPNMLVGANGSGRAFYQGFTASSEKSVEGVLASGEDLAGKPLWVRGSAFPMMVFDTSRNTPTTVGAYTNTVIEAIISEDNAEEARITAISDMGGVLNFGWTNDSNRFNLGMQFRPIMRYAYEDRIPSSDLINKGKMTDHLKDDSNISQGTGVDFGILFTVADFWYPTIGFSILNLPTGCRDEYLNPFTLKRETVCGNKFSGSFANPDALSTVDPTDFRLGFSITPRLSRGLGLRLAVDAHHIPVGTDAQSYGLQGIEVSKMLHAGIELFTGNPLVVSPLAVRTGYNQGFVTIGGTLHLGFMTLEFASYGADVSSSAKPVEDRRYVGSFTFDFN